GGSIGEPPATPGLTRKKPGGRQSPTGFYALSGFWGAAASLGLPAAWSSAADEVQRSQAAGQDDGADPAQAVFGQGLQLLGRALPATGGDQQHQAFEDGDQAEGGPEVLHGSGSLWIGAGPGAGDRTTGTPPSAFGIAPRQAGGRNS